MLEELRFRHCHNFPSHSFLHLRSELELIAFAASTALLCTARRYQEGVFARDLCSTYRCKETVSKTKVTAKKVQENFRGIV